MRSEVFSKLFGALMNSAKSVGVAAVRTRDGKTILYACLFLTLCSIGLSGQTRSQSPIPQSELARQNSGRVAASYGQLVAILHRDAGILIELKHWIAKDATDHGQLIADQDLTDEAIFDRLEVDIAFRAVATMLVQKYGYLQPAINPESPLAKEQELVSTERAKWLAQEAEEERATARREQSNGLQQTQVCDPRVNAICPSTQNGTYPYPSSQQQTGQPGVNQIPMQVPGLQTPQTYPGPANPYGPPQQTVPANPPNDLLRTSGQDQILMEQGGQNGTMGGTTGETQNLPGNQNALDNGYSQRANQNPFQNQQSTVPGIDFDNWSQTSDQGSDGFNQGSTQGPYPGAGNNSEQNLYASGPYGASYTTPYGTNPSASRYPFPGSNAAAYDNFVRARESTTLNQRLVQRRNPYDDIPSLYDMYLQAAARPPAVERFGMQVFLNGTRDLQMLPTDLPVGPDYVLGSGDALTVDLWGGVARRLYRIVDREGRIDLPEVGPVMVAGKSLAEVQEAVQKTLRTQFRDVSADVSLSRLRTIRVYVVGDVLRPGAYDIGSLSTPLNALFAAGGPTGRGSLRILKHYRGNDLVQDVDVYDLLLHGVKGDIERLENGDTVMVPPLGPEITVEGMVRRPAIYEEKDEKSLADALALAGGLLPTATLRHIEVQRVVAHQKQTMLSLDIPPDDSTEAATKQMDDFQIHDGDKIRIFPIAPYNQDAVYLEGHVLRPGKYSYRDGMKVTDLIGSYKDLLPEPAAQYGEIIRLTQPDYRPEVQSFNVAEALADPAKAPALQPLDTVQIFGRYDFENPPQVSVLGDVRAPGTYRTSGDIHLSDAIHRAGGLLADAATADAQVFRYMPDSTMKILDVKLSGALEGNPADNIMLNSRDRVLVHRNAAAADPPTVYVKGEVARPGRYPLTADMRISDLVRAAGGLKQSADTKRADLTHYVWKNDKQVTGEQQPVLLADALIGKPDANPNSSNPELSNGDVLTVRQVPGWDDLGASIVVRGEVVHPGTYGIRPGERLSSIIERAGGFGPLAYPYGTVLMRPEVQQLEQRSYGELIQRVREQQATLKLTATTATDPDQKLSAESALAQWQSTLDSLTSSPPIGRVTIQVSSNVHTWANTSRDITVRTGDILVVPKRPSYVLVQGQVYGPTAVGYRPGKSARWYLMQAGGATNMANKRGIFVIRADGTVIGSHGSLWLTGDSLSVALQPGDMVVVPERPLGGPPIWKILFQNAQVLSSIATNVILATAY
jgi:protein involved in polysaccharide export with SLBB domain